MPVDTIDNAKADVRTRIRDLIDYSSAQGIPEEATEVVFSLLHGHLRGKFPQPVPDDLMGVAMSAALRYSDLLSEYKTVRATGLEVSPGGLC